MHGELELKELREEIEAIKARNKRVEADKAWETSWTRSIFIAIVTLFLAYILMLLIDEVNPFPKAVAGSTFYLLSTLTYGVLKNWWLAKRI